MIGVACVLLASCGKRTAGNPMNDGVGECPEPEHAYCFGLCVDSLDRSDYRVRRGDTFSKIYDELGFTPSEADRIVRASAEFCRLRLVYRHSGGMHIFRVDFGPVMQA